MAFLNVRVFNPTDMSLKKTYQINEKEKKRAYNERFQEIERGSFIPIVMLATGGMARECNTFYSCLSEMIDEKRD